MSFIPCMKASSYPSNNPPSYGHGLYAEPKLDGHRHLVRVHRDGKIESWSSQAKDAMRKMEHGLIRELRKWDPGVYDGELHMGPGHTSSEVAKIVNRPRLIFEAFDVLEDDGDSSIQLLSYTQRRRNLLVMARQNDRAGTSPSEFISSHDNMKLLRDKEWEVGGEGLMLKRPHSIYKPGKRTKDWLKVKGCNIALTTIIGYIPPNPEKPFEHGAVHLEDKEGRKTSVKVLNLAEKRYCLELHASGILIGKRIQIEYQSIIQGSYRHPRWDHWL